MLTTKIRPVGLLVAMFIFFALAVPGIALAYVIPLDVAELTALSETVAEIEVLDSESRAQRSNARVVRIDSDISMRVVQVLKGRGRSSFVLSQPGGTADGVTLSVSEMPTFEPGDRAIVFLDGNGVVGGWQGKLEIVDGTVPALGMTLAEAHKALREIARTGTTSVVGTVGSEYAGAEGADDSGFAIASAPVTLLDSTFEGASTSGWTMSGNPTWAPTTYRASGGSYSLYGSGGGSSGVRAPGPSPVSVYSTVRRTSAIDLRQYSVATLSWDVWTGLSTNSNNWTNVRLGTSASGPWYTPKGYFAMGSGQGWRSYELDLSNVVDQWSNDSIDFTKTPELWVSIIYSHTSGSADEGVYFDNVRVTAEDIPTPTIDFVTPAFAKGNAGERVTIYGSGFGSSRGTGRVDFLRGNRSDGSMVPATVVESWSDNRIVVEVPRYAQSGPVRVVDNAGVSGAGYIYETGVSFTGRSWAAGDLPVTFRINENAAGTTGERGAITAAMQTWSSAGSNLRFTYGGSTDTASYPPEYDVNGDNEIYFTSDETMPTGVLAQAFYWWDPSNDYLLKSDIVFNDARYNWSVGAASGKFDIESIALHELGHAVGLDDQYGSLDRAMGAMPSGQTRRNISVHEVIGTMHLYGLDGSVEAPRALTVEAIAGSSRFATAVEISKRAFPEGLAAGGARTVVIATGRNWPDALGGTALAGALEGPILLVDKNSVPAVVVAEIGRLGAERAIILGGEGALSSAVEAALAAQLGGDDRVERIAGQSRYDTADAAAARVIGLLGNAYDGTAIVTTGANYPDALAASPLAAANGWPLFLTRPKGLSENSLKVMSSMGAPKRVLLLGGSGVVSAEVEADLNARFTAADVRRLAGSDRYSTAVAVANYGVNEAGMHWDGVAIATGQNFPDALAGGVLQGGRGSVMVLTRTARICNAALGSLTTQKSSIDGVSYLGGTGAVHGDVRETVRLALE